MNVTRMPGFTAESALNMTGTHYRTGRNYEQLDVAGQIVPQLRATFCQNDPEEKCWYVCCTITEGPYGVGMISCGRDWVCGHRAPTGAATGISQF